MSERVMGLGCLFAGLTLCIWAYSSLRKGEIKVPLGTCKRSENPVNFWVNVWSVAFVGAISLGAGIDRVFWG